MNDVKCNWPKCLSIVVAVLFALYMYGCEPHTRSLHPGNAPVTRQELQLELEIMQRRFEISSSDLAQKEAVRDLITQNLLLMAQDGTPNPIGFITGIAAIYGIGSAGSSVKNSVKKRLLKNGAKSDTS